MKSNIKWYDNNKNGEMVHFNPEIVKAQKFKPFKKGSIVFGGHFGDEGKGKLVDIIAADYKKEGYKLLSVRGQGSGNAGHTVIVSGQKFDFHYLTSAGLEADIMLLGPGMLIDPLRILKEEHKLPPEKRGIIKVAERATMVTDLDRAMDSWCENQRAKAGQKVIGTTKSGVGPGAGNRGYRIHITFADALACVNVLELKELLLKNPLFPDEVKAFATDEYVEELWQAIHKLNIVDSVKLVSQCREEKYAVLLEVSQAIGLDPLFGNGGHFCTSTPCTDMGGAAFSGLTLKDFKDGSYMVFKAYASKVGGGPFNTRFTEKENEIADFIYAEVGECGVTTGRKRDLGWFDGVAARYAIALTGADICVNCMDIIAALSEVTDYVKICFAYRNKYTGEITYDWQYNLSNYEPLYIEIPIAGLVPEEIIPKYITALETVIGKRISYYGVGPDRDDIRKRADAFE